MANVLVVDDNHEVAAPLIMFLELEGHEVRYADSGETGLTAIRERIPELIFLDVEMPELSGPEMAYRLIVEDSGKEDTPIILLSGVGTLEQVAEKIGTPYFMAKPFGLSELKTLLDRALTERCSPRPNQQIGDEV
jgi:DNA-binding NtrC family response regulator